MSASVAPKTARARLAAASRHHPDSNHVDLRRDLAAAKLETYVQRILDAAPPLTADQRDRVSALLHLGGGASE